MANMGMAKYQSWTMNLRNSRMDRFPWSAEQTFFMKKIADKSVCPTLSVLFTGRRSLMPARNPAQVCARPAFSIKQHGVGDFNAKARRTMRRIFSVMVAGLVLAAWLGFGQACFAQGAAQGNQGGGGSPKKNRQFPGVVGGYLGSNPMPSFNNPWQNNPWQNPWNNPWQNNFWQNPW